MRFDSARRYRLVCAHLDATPRGAFCRLDSAQIRPELNRVLFAWTAPWILLALLSLAGAWTFLRFGTGLKDISPLDVAWPSRWSRVAELKRRKFTSLALFSIQRGDFAQAGVSLFTAARIGKGGMEDNKTLARLATLGGYHSLADELHGQNIADHPENAEDLALAWHDDLLISHRQLELARLALARLGSPGAPREFWLRAFLESIRHPGVAAPLLAEESASATPHQGLRHALLARRAIDRRDKISAIDELLALSAMPPGDAARTFLTRSWLDLHDAARAAAAAISTAHPAAPGDVSVLAHELLRASGDLASAQAVLRQLFGQPALRAKVLAALVRHEDGALLAEFVSSLPEDSRSDPRLLAGIWIAARRAGAAALAVSAEIELEKCGRPVPEELRAKDASPVRREALRFAGALLMPDREVLIALHAAP